MSPSDKIEVTINSDSKEERESHSQEVVKPNGTDQLPKEVASSSATDVQIPEHGTITNIPLFTAKISTLKCSENDQMKTFDPGEASNIENASNKQCGYSLKFPLKNNSNSVSKNNKNYKAGSKINKLADMLAKRSQNIVEMTQNVTSDVITDIIGAPKVEGNSNTMDISDIAKTEDKVGLSVVFCGGTVNNQPVGSVKESLIKSVPNENSENIKQLQSQLSHTWCLNISELLTHGTGVSEFNALRERLMKSETDGSTKTKKEFRKNLKNVGLSLILPEKKRRSSPRNKLFNSKIDEECNDDDNQQDTPSAKAVTTVEKATPSRVNEQKKSAANSTKKTDKTKSAKQRKSKLLVETSTQTFSTDFAAIDWERVYSEAGVSPPVGSEPATTAAPESEVKEVPAEKPESQAKPPADENPQPATPEDKSDPVVTNDCEEQSESGEKEEPTTKPKSESGPEDVKEEIDGKELEKCVYACMYCPAPFVTKTECKDHELSHSFSKDQQVIKCQFCNKQYPSLLDLKSHCIKNHPNKYAYCVKCDERFCEKTLLYSHNKSLHLTKAMEEAQNLVKIQETLGINPRDKTKEEIEEIRKSFDKKNGKPAGSKSDLKVDVSYDSAKKSSTSPRAVQKASPKEKTEEQLLEMEMLFYSHLSGNIKENLTNHLDGKIDKNGNPIQTDIVSESCENSQAKPKSTNLLSVVTASNSGVPDQVSRAPSPYQTRSKTPNPLPPTAKKFKKLPNWQQKFWEKYNFPTNYRFEHRFWDKNYLNTEKSAFYLKDLSCLDIKTQLTMRENIKKLEDMKSKDESNKPDKLTFPEYLSLVPKVFDGSSQKASGEGVNLDYLKTNNQGREEKKPPKTLAGDFNRPRRKGSLDNTTSKRQLEKNASRTPDGSKMMTRRRSVIELSKTSKGSEDTAKRRNGSLDVADAQKTGVRRQTSVDGLQKTGDADSGPKGGRPANEAAPESSVNPSEGDDTASSLTGFAEISGEWVRPRSYLCGTCCAKFTNLWELEDHKWVSHPNVWCTHYEFEDEKIDKLFHRNEAENADDSEVAEDSALSKLKLTDLYKRYLLPHGSLKTAKLVPNVSFPEQCTKCKKNCMNLSEMHKHMLDCGGDTTWFLTMYSSPMTIKRKWRPFGSRRRKQIGRRVLKRNIPNTSNMRPYAYQHRIRTKPGDVESIQKMLANLPEKRARRAINFDEIKTRSQATIHSNRLLRKRFKVSFGTNIMRLKALKQQRQAKPVKKESSSKSTTDTSSENTPTGSPKRRNRLKETNQSTKEESSAVGASHEAVGGESKKKGRQEKKKKHGTGKQDPAKKGLKKESRSKKNGKPFTRSNSSGSVEASREAPKKKRGQLTENESVPKVDTLDSSRSDLKDKKNVIDKNGKGLKKKSHHKAAPEKVVKKEPAQGSGGGVTSAPRQDKECVGKKKTKTEVDDEKTTVTDSEMGTTQEGKDTKKGKKGRLPSKNILRLKSNDKEKTELIKRIRKTLRNSKRILEKRENKDKYERRRSLRIQTLQLTEVTPKPNQEAPNPSIKDTKESHTPEVKRPRSPQPDRDPPSTTKRASKILRSLRGSDSNPSEDVPASRRSSRNSATSADEKPEVATTLDCKIENPSERDHTENLKKTSEAALNGTLVENQSESAETAKRCAVAENHRSSKPVEDDPEAVRKSSRFHTPKTTREGESEAPKTCPSLRTVRNASLSSELPPPFESKNFDLSEMPVLDKEEPVRGRTTRKSESDIPVLMPYENEEKVDAREEKTSKRKGIVTFKVVSKRRRSSESLNPLKIVKETELVPVKVEPTQANAKSKTKSKASGLVDGDVTSQKKRKRSHVQEPPGTDRKCSKSPKVKKYFLGICPNEIDKGGDSKDESGSDSEPLITLVLNQKQKEKVEAPPPVQEPEPPPQAVGNESDATPRAEEATAESEPQPQDVNLRSKKDVKKAESPTRVDPPEEPSRDEPEEEPPCKEEVAVEEKADAPEVEILQETIPPRVPESPTPKPKEPSPSLEYELKKQQPVKKSLKGLKMTVKLKEATLKIVDCSAMPLPESKWSPRVTENISEAIDASSKDQRQEEETAAVEAVAPEATEVKVERRSRRVSKEIKSTSEFVLDDPLILVDELWSDLDSDSDDSRKRSKKGKKKSAKKKVHEEKKESSVDLEELLRNFGERKDPGSKPEVAGKKPCLKVRPEVRRKRLVVTHLDKRKKLETRIRIEQRSYKRLSLRLFRFHRKLENFGCLGRRLANSKKREVAGSEPKADLPTLPFLAAEIKENPVQIIQCGVQKVKAAKKSARKSDAKPSPNMQLKISLPLQSINNLAVLNNNHLTELSLADNAEAPKPPCRAQDSEAFAADKEPVRDNPKPEEPAEGGGVALKNEEALEPGDSKLRSRRSEVIDKIFYCEICKTYYYSSSQLKIHKLSNRHKMKELELSARSEERPTEEAAEGAQEETEKEVKPPARTEDGGRANFAHVEKVDPEKMNEDTSEMPILEGPFIENPFMRLEVDGVEPPLKPSPPPPPPPSSNAYGFTESCLKDIQRAIGCTDEEMLILTLLGENSIELEGDILDLDSCQPLASTKENAEEMKERESSNGMFKTDFKKRITSALARLVNKALLNILEKYQNTNRTGISPEALSFLVKLSTLNCKKNLFDLNELLRSESEGESSNRMFFGEDDAKDRSLPFKYFCTICGARFQKDSTMEWHFLRYHRPRVAKRGVEDVTSDPVSVGEEEKEEPALSCKYSCSICGSRFQSESTRECHIIRSHLTKGSKALEEPSSSPVFVRDIVKKEPNAPYKYLCTICGSRFQKESMWECHIKRSHNSKSKKVPEEVPFPQTMYEDDWSSSWTYDINDELPGSVEAPQFLCSDCGINFTSPQEVLEHQKLEHAGQKDSELSESGPLQSSKIGSSDEILKGRKTPRTTSKHLSKAELDHQRIIAKSELRKLDRKFPSKSRAGRGKWGLDALKFTVEKENKAVPQQEEKEETVEEPPKPVIDPKNIDMVPKLNLSRTNNIPEFKVVQKTTCMSRFHRLLDNKMKRKSTRGDGKEGEESMEKVFAEPVAVIKRERRRKPNRCSTKKEVTRKIFDVYDFNDSESEPEPMAFSHVKKIGPAQSPTKLKFVKVKDATETSKNKADSTTKDPETEDYDSEDSLPLSVVKRTKTEEDDEEMRGEDQVEKPEGILEQVEYLIEQLENETSHPKSKEEEEKGEEKEEDAKLSNEKKGRSKLKREEGYTPEESVDSQPETFRVSLENKFLQLESLAGKKKDQDVDENTCESQESISTNSLDKVEEVTVEKPDEISPVADSSQGISDEEDSLPLVLMSKKNDLTAPEPDFTQSVSKTAVLDTPEESSLFPRRDDPFGVLCEDEEKVQLDDSIGSPKISVESLTILSTNDIEEPSEKSDKSFETLNGNVIYRRNDSMSGFDSDMSDYETLDSNAEKANPCHEENESLIKEVMEKEDVVIVCSKKEQDAPKSGKKKAKESPKKKKQSADTAQRKKRILPLLSVTLEENNFRKSESPKLKKDVIMKKIWSRRRFPDDLLDENSEISTGSRDNEISIENFNNEDSHSEIDKEIIMKKIWNKKRLEHESESGDVLATKSGSKPEDVKINQTEISDEVVIKCGPKTKATPKRRKSRSSTKESSKERIMRKIWSGKCTFQTKAALKTYDSDILQSSKDSDGFDEQTRVKKRGRPPNILNSKKPKILSDDDEDDLDSLLEEIEREEVEKAIRLEFLQLRRSDKANVEVAKEGGNMTVGLFAESCRKESREVTDRRRKRIRKNVKHPRKNLLRQRKFIKKPTAKQAPPPQQEEEQVTAQAQPPTPAPTTTTQEPEEEGEDEDEDGEARVPNSIEGRLSPDPTPPSDSALGTNEKSFDLESKLKNRKHKKHRHKHHHHKHKHKKSKHHKYMVGKHKLKHKSADGVKEKADEFENFSILEKMCQDIPNQIEKQSQKRFELDALDTKLDEVLMSTSSSYEGKAKECDDLFYEGRRIENDRNYGVETGSIYEFDEDDSGFLGESKGRHKN